MEFQREHQLELRGPHRERGRACRAALPMVAADSRRERYATRRAKKVKGADKLLRLEVDLGYEKRQILAGGFCYFMVTKIKNIFGYDDSLDAFGVHGAGGTLGAILTGLLASSAINPIFKDAKAQAFPMKS